MLRIDGNTVTADLLTFKNIIADAIKIATDATKGSQFISKSEAYEMYGRRNVEKWVGLGVVKQYRDAGSKKIRISKTEIATVATANNRLG